MFDIIKLMKLYLLKENMIHMICHCPKDLVIPTNDFHAYDFYKTCNHLYDKTFIANTQNIIHGDNKTLPTNFPVIVRPIINLCGMGKGAYFSNTIDEIKEMSEECFWSEILTGDHISVDIFYNNSTIQGIIAFLGVPDNLFKFQHWEYLKEYVLPESIIKWIHEHLKDYNGVFNIEIIGSKIIECHLRSGDLNYFQNKTLTEQVILCHLNKEITIPKLNKIYLVPVFVKKGDYFRIKTNDLFYCANKTNTKKYILNYFIDPSPKYFHSPIGGDRLCIFTTTDIEQGYKLRNEIIMNLYSKNKWSFLI